MPTSNFGAGFTDGVIIRGFPLTQTHPGRVWWVSNSTVQLPNQKGGSNSNAGTFNAPFSTLQKAIDSATSSRGDVIMIKPNHAETVTSSTALAFNKAGVAIIGLGTGTSRPTFTLNTANTTTINVSVANVSIQNCIFVANFLTIAACFTLTTAASFAVEKCVFRDTAANLNFANIIQSSGAANTVDGLYVVDNIYWSIGTTFNTFVISANDIDSAEISRNRVGSISTADFATLAIISAGVVTGMSAVGNVTVRKNTTNTVALISSGGTTSTGIVQGNFCRALDTSGNVVVVTTVGFACQGNSYSGVLSAQGFPIPALDS